MEKISKETNDCHRQILNIATKLYNTTSKNLNESYYKGRKDSYEEILNWILNNCKNERYINPNNFNNLLIEKIAKVKISLKEDDDIENFLSSEKKEKKNFIIKIVIIFQIKIIKFLMNIIFFQLVFQVF
jgi:hypothetical protein